MQGLVASNASVSGVVVPDRGGVPGRMKDDGCIWVKSGEVSMSMAEAV